MDEEAIEVIPGRWWIPKETVERMVIGLSSGHYVRLRPAVYEGRVVVDEMTFSRTAPKFRHPSHKDGKGHFAWTLPNKKFYEEGVQRGKGNLPIGGPITSEVVRSFSFEFFFAEIQNGVVDADGRRMSEVVNTDNIKRLRDNGPTLETLSTVADLYRLAYAVGQPPTKRVEEVFEIPRSTAGRWVTLARKQGLLGEAAGPGRAGA